MTAAVPPATERCDVIIPDIGGRAANVKRLMESLTATAPLATAWYICDPGGDETAALARQYGARVLGEPGSFAHKVNWAYRNIAPNAGWILLVGDDVAFHPGWLDHAQAVARRTGAEVIGTNDLLNPRVMSGDHTTHPMIRRSYIDTVGASWDGPGVVCHEGYGHCYVDDEIVLAAKSRQTFQMALDSCVPHFHPMGGVVADDAVYRKGQRTREADKARLLQRIMTYSGRTNSVGVYPAPDLAADTPWLVGAVMCKDEVDVIGRCIDSMWAAGCDEVVVLDTGSTDGTPDRARATWIDRDGMRAIPTVVEAPWRGFADSRTELVNIVRSTRTDNVSWLLMLDADMTIETTGTVPLRERLRLLDPEVGVGLLVLQLETATNRRVALLRCDIPWEYRGEGATGVHEVAVDPTDSPSSHNAALIDGFVLVHHGEAGTERDPAEELATFEVAIAREPDEPRFRIYAARCLRSLNRPAEAREHYRHLAAIGDVARDEWAWYGAWQDAELGVLTEPDEVTTAALAAVFVARPSRAEPLYSLARRHAAHARWAAMERCAAQAAATPLPTTGLWIMADVYEWGGLLELATAQAALKKFAEALATCETLAERNLPASVRAEVIANVNRWVRAAEAEAAAVPVGIILPTAPPVTPGKLWTP